MKYTGGILEGKSEFLVLTIKQSRVGGILLTGNAAPTL